ncbi:MAG: YgcG family protein, partial [Betaproteobacteria bacterium]|nr:YgcG family protein [Betaproteobacteria bacterium]
MNRRAEIKRQMFLAGLLIFLVYAATAQSQIKVPELTGRVVDLTATLDANQQQDLDQQLRVFEQKKGTQIAMLIVPS